MSPIRIACNLKHRVLREKMVCIGYCFSIVSASFWLLTLEIVMLFRVKMVKEEAI